MKLFKRVLIIVGAISLLVLLCCCHEKKSQDIWVVGTNATYLPYEFIDSQGKVVGFDVDLAQALSRKLGKTLEVQEFAFDALILNLKQHRIDAILAGMSITQDRLKEIHMIPYEGEELRELTLVSKNKHPHKDLSKYSSVAVQTGTFHEEFLRTLPGVRIRSFDTALEVMMEVRYNKSPVAIFEPTVARLALKEFPEMHPTVYPLPESFWVLGNGIGIAKDRPEHKEEVLKALQEIRESGELAKLQKAWGLQP